MIKTIIFTDLDDSLFSSYRRLKESGFVPTDYPVASVKLDGSAICFQTPKQRGLYTLLLDADLIIPVTGRSSESIQRVRLPSFSSYKIASHGAVIHNALGEMMSDWREEIESEISAWSTRLHHVYQELCRWRDSIEDDSIDQSNRVRVRLVSDEGMPVYVSVKGPECLLDEQYKRLGSSWTEGRIHHNRRDLALLPHYANKARAVAYLIDHLHGIYQEPLLTIGIGDSLSDIPFLKLCDFTITPQKSAIQELLSSIGAHS